MKNLPEALLLLLAIPAIYITNAQKHRMVQCAACGDLGNDTSLEQCYTTRSSLNVKLCPDGCMFMFMKRYDANPYIRYNMARRDCEFTFDIYTDEYGCYGSLPNFARFHNFIYCTCNDTWCNSELSGAPMFGINDTLPPIPEVRFDNIPVRINELNRGRVHINVKASLLFILFSFLCFCIIKLE